MERVLVKETAAAVGLMLPWGTSVTVLPDTTSSCETLPGLCAQLMGWWDGAAHGEPPAWPPGALLPQVGTQSRSTHSCSLAKGGVQRWVCVCAITYCSLHEWSAACRLLRARVNHAVLWLLSWVFIHLSLKWLLLSAINVPIAYFDLELVLKPFLQVASDRTRGDCLKLRRGRLGRILGKNSLLNGWSGIRIGCPGKWWSHQPWRHLKDV